MISIKYATVAGIAISASLILAVTAILPNSAISLAQQQSNGNNSATPNPSGDQNSPAFLFKLNKKYADYQGGVFKVRAGVGNYIAPLTQFFPGTAEIKVGETVMWYNPTQVGEPHTVTFIMGPAGFADPEAPFIVSNSSAITALNSTANAEPAIMPGPGGKTIAIIANERSYLPISIDKSGTVTHLPMNANYTASGDEQFINSGWMWPVGQAPPGFPSISTFSVKFEKAGTYYYLCMVHPWMTGQVVVK